MLNFKKSQISLFVIFGAILVVVLAFIFFSGQFQFFQSYETKLKNQVSDIVEDCVYDSANNGLFLIGYQGGYIDLPENRAYDTEEYVDFGLKIATWDSQRGDVPTISSMESELEDFIDEEAMICVSSSLDTLSETMEINISSDLTSNVEIQEQNVRVFIDLPVSFREYNSEEVLSTNSYSVNIDSLRLGDMYSLATQIFNEEVESQFVEELVLDQIFSAGDYSSELSMPSQGMYFSCSRRVWTYPQLKENLANLNNNNFKYLHFEGTYPIDYLFDIHLDGENGPEEFRDYYENNYFFELDNPQRSYNNYRVELLMPSTEITGEEGILTRYPYREFEVNPSSGSIVKSMDLDIDVSGFDIPLPCIQVFHHTYTLDYDLIVKVTDMTEDGQGYSFQFPLRVLIENNNPKEDQNDFPIVREPLTANNEAFCSNESKQYPLQVYVQDTYGNYLNDVNISYKCINLQCNMGQTSRPSFQGIERFAADPRLDAEFPFCVGGQIIAEKEGYHRSELRVDTDSELLDMDPPIFYDIEMIPTKEYSVDESSFLVVDRDTGLGSRVYDESDGSIYVNIENDEYDFETEAIWPTESSSPLKTLELLDLDNVKYNVSVYYMDDEFGFRGLIELENYEEIDIYSGNSIEFVIPTSSTEIEPEEYEEFYDFMQRAVRTSSYGINFR